MRKTSNPLYERYFKSIDLSTQGYIFPTLPGPYDYVLNEGSSDTYHIEIVIPENLSGTKPKTMEDLDKVELFEYKPRPVSPVRTRSPIPIVSAPGPVNFMEAPGPRMKPIRG